MKKGMEKPRDFLESNKAILNLKNHKKNEKNFPTRKKFPEILKTKKATTKIMKFPMKLMKTSLWIFGIFYASKGGNIG